VTCDFILLSESQLNGAHRCSSSLTSSSAIRFWINKAIRESRYRTSFSRTKFFLDCEDILDFRSRSIFCAGGVLAACAAGSEQDLYLLQDHPQSLNPFRLQKSTCTASSWSTASTVGPTSLHRGTTWCSGGILVGRRRRRLLTPETGSEALRSSERVIVEYMSSVARIFATSRAFFTNRVV
jgi:hypothetical protein